MQRIDSSFYELFYLFGQKPYPLDYCTCEKGVERKKLYRFSLMIPTLVIMLVKLALWIPSVVLINFCDVGTYKNHSVETNIFLFSEMIKIIAIYFTQINFLDVSQQLMGFSSIVAYMNVLFFIDLVKDHLAHLNKIVAEVHSDWGGNDENVFVVKKKAQSVNMIRKQLSKYKTVHFRLWKITEKLNEFFGWTLIAIILQSFIELVFSAIWELRVLNRLRDIIRLTRKNYCHSFTIIIQTCI